MNQYNDSVFRLAIITSHPIQYNAPFFKALNKEPGIDVKVFYTWGQSEKGVYDPGFDKKRTWDIPMLDGYAYEFIDNISKKPGSDHFTGIINKGLNKKISEWKPDGILVYGWAFVSHLKVIKHFYGKIPVLFRGDSTLLQESTKMKAFLRKLFLSWVYRSIDIALYVGKHNYQYFRSHSVAKRKLVHMPHVVDNERFEKEVIIKNDVIEAVKEAVARKLTFLYAGKFEPIKNPVLLLEAFKNLNRDDAALVFVGNGVLESELKSKSLLEKNVHFLPFLNQSEIPAAYKIGDVLVLCSKSETWGLAVNEAMASGLVCIVNEKVGCAPDLVESDHSGLVFKEGDAGSLKTQMERYFDPLFLKEQKVRSKEKIKHFTISNNVSVMVNLLAELKRN